MLDIENLKDFAAAYEAALHNDFCPSAADVTETFNEIDTQFSWTNFQRGAGRMEGKSPSEIADCIIAVIADLDYE